MAQELTIKEKLFEANRMAALNSIRSISVVTLLRNPSKIPDKPGIYIMYHATKGKPYVGESVNVRRRLLQHVQVKWPQQYIDREIRKLGNEQFRVAFLEFSPDFKVRRKREAYYVNLFNAYHYGYNGSVDGHPMSKLERELRKRGKKFMTKYFNSYNKKRKRRLKYSGGYALKRYSKKMNRLNRR